jgi:hypothetical protein
LNLAEGVRNLGGGNLKLLESVNRDIRTSGFRDLFHQTVKSIFLFASGSIQLSVEVRECRQNISGAINLELCVWRQRGGIWLLVPHEGVNERLYVYKFSLLRREILVDVLDQCFDFTSPVVGARGLLKLRCRTFAVRKQDSRYGRDLFSGSSHWIVTLECFLDLGRLKPGHELS